MVYSKTCVKRALSKRPKIGLQLSLNAGLKVLQNAPRGAFCNTFDLHYATNCFIKIFVLSIFEWPFYTGFTIFDLRLTIMGEKYALS